VAANRDLAALGAARGATAAQVALAWTMRHPDVMAIPKAVRADHLRENIAAADIILTADELAAIDRLFPPPSRKLPLTMT
jgi:diketogulonate reductase-like aldo/keto reductase